MNLFILPRELYDQQYFPYGYKRNFLESLKNYSFTIMDRFLRFYLSL